MAELATIARPYAQALFEAARGDLDQTSAWLNALAWVAENPQLQAFAAHPQAASSKVIEVMSSVAQVALSEQAKNFLQAVIGNDRLAVLPEIAKQFAQMKNAKDGVSDAVIYSAFPLEEVAKLDLVANLEKRFGKRLKARVELDSSLIGGVRVVVGDEVFDTSVKARLEQMKVALTA